MLRDRSPIHQAPEKEFREPLAFKTITIQNDVTIYHAYQESPDVIRTKNELLLHADEGPGSDHVIASSTISSSSITRSTRLTCIRRSARRFDSSLSLHSTRCWSGTTWEPSS